jgi:hypothetical protein
MPVSFELDGSGCCLPIREFQHVLSKAPLPVVAPSPERTSVSRAANDCFEPKADAV